MCDVDLLSILGYVYGIIIVEEDVIVVVVCVDGFFKSLFLVVIFFIVVSGIIVRGCIEEGFVGRLNVVYLVEFVVGFVVLYWICLNIFDVGVVIVVIEVVFVFKVCNVGDVVCNWCLID